jgi:hypothetical protein
VEAKLTPQAGRYPEVHLLDVKTEYCLHIDHRKKLSGLIAYLVNI